MNNLRQDGFTLIELLIATSIFLIVATVSVASLLASTKSVRKIQSDQDVHQAARIAFEQMSRDIRQAKGVACQSAGDLSNCSLTAVSDPRVVTDYLQICTQDGSTRREYREFSSKIQVRERKVSGFGWSEWSDITPSSIFVIGRFSGVAGSSEKLFQLFQSHSADTADTCTANHNNPIYLNPFVELAAEFRNFPDLATPPPPEKQSRITLQTMVSLRNFAKQYNP